MEIGQIVLYQKKELNENSVCSILEHTVADNSDSSYRRKKEIKVSAGDATIIKRSKR